MTLTPATVTVLPAAVISPITPQGIIGPYGTRTQDNNYYRSMIDYFPLVLHATNVVISV